jgi:hypothetical protein
LATTRVANHIRPTACTLHAIRIWNFFRSTAFRAFRRRNCACNRTAQLTRHRCLFTERIAMRVRIWDWIVSTAFFCRSSPFTFIFFARSNSFTSRTNFSCTS